MEPDNEDGVFRFVETARHFQEESQITLLFSAVSDKDYKDMIRTICQGIRLDQVVTTQIDGYRVVPAQELAQLFRDCGCPDVTAEPEIPKAFAQARKKQGDGLLFCVGSLYLVGEIKDEIRSRPMINYEEELKKFKPVQDVTDAEGAIYNRELTDVMDLMKEILKETNPGTRRK